MTTLIDRLILLTQGLAESDAMTLVEQSDGPEALAEAVADLASITGGEALTAGNSALLAMCPTLLSVLNLDSSDVDELYRRIVEILTSERAAQDPYLRAARYALGVNHPDANHPQHKLFSTSSAVNTRRKAFLPTINRGSLNTAKSREKVGFVRLVEALRDSRIKKADGLMLIVCEFSDKDLQVSWTPIDLKADELPSYMDPSPDDVPTRTLYVGDHGALKGKLVDVDIDTGAELSPYDSMLRITSEAGKTITSGIRRRYSVSYKDTQLIHIRLYEHTKSVSYHLEFPETVLPRFVWAFSRSLDPDGTCQIWPVVPQVYWGNNKFYHCFEKLIAPCEVGFMWSWD